MVSPLGTGRAATWQALLEARSGIGRITRFDSSDFCCHIAGEVSGFDPLDFMDKKEARKSDVFIQYAVAASQLALDDAGFVIDDSNAARVAVHVGAGIGGLPLIESMHTVLLERGPSRISPFFIPGLIANMAAGQVSIKTGAKGPNHSPCTACTTGLHAIGDAFRNIQLGYADAAIAGGSEGPLTPLGLGGFCAMRALSTRNDDPQTASRPWDKDRDGFVMAEGSGIVVLEEYEQAEKRGAHIYAEIVGYGQSGDAYHISAPHPEGEGAARVMEAAIADAEIDKEQVVYINAHGTSTELGDRAEVLAIRRVFGEHADRLAVSSTKSSTGHLLGAAGGIETGILALAIDQGVIPATLNLETPGEDCDLDFVPGQPRRQPIPVALNNSFGFGGTNGALVLVQAS
ncbi:MAG: beta-ketoacyl-[acyl-carrier-protein] synthase II [Acidobacteria bacterium]|nr:MAG: beta-ketoacyl-[acyl-carrier-protein] synthase II [Acidobacteriota bacterium]REK08755.1 MAG: beta-ketoacyl-[acyl-carrier-protein] synthase II [Acidobacteriota bacterium]